MHLNAAAKNSALRTVPRRLCAPRTTGCSKSAHPITCDSCHGLKPRVMLPPLSVRHGDACGRRRVEGSLPALSRVPDLVSHHRFARQRQAAAGRCPGGPGCTHDYVDSLQGDQRDRRTRGHSPTTSSATATPRAFRTRARISGHPLCSSGTRRAAEASGHPGSLCLSGQSWGGMLGAEHAVLKPTGLKALVIANSPATCIPGWRKPIACAGNCRRRFRIRCSGMSRPGRLPIRNTSRLARLLRPPCLPRHPVACRSRAHLCDHGRGQYGLSQHERPDRVPRNRHDEGLDDRGPADADRSADPLISGKYDEATPLVVKPYVDRVKGLRMGVFEHSSHMPHVEEKDCAWKRSLVSCHPTIPTLDKTTAVSFMLLRWASPGRRFLRALPPWRHSAGQ